MLTHTPLTPPPPRLPSPRAAESELWRFLVTKVLSAPTVLRRQIFSELFWWLLAQPAGFALGKVLAFNLVSRVSERFGQAEAQIAIGTCLSCRSVAPNLFAFSVRTCLVRLLNSLRLRRSGTHNRLAELRSSRRCAWPVFARHCAAVQQANDCFLCPVPARHPSLLAGHLCARDGVRHQADLVSCSPRARTLSSAPRFERARADAGIRE